MGDFLFGYHCGVYAGSLGKKILVRKTRHALAWEVRKDMVEIIKCPECGITGWTNPTRISRKIVWKKHPRPVVRPPTPDPKGEVKILKGRY